MSCGLGTGLCLLRPSILDTDAMELSGIVRGRYATEVEKSRFGEVLLKASWL